MTQFCACGAQPGYAHYAGCPYPLYDARGEALTRWYEAAAARREGAAEKPTEGGREVKP